VGEFGITDLSQAQEELGVPDATGENVSVQWSETDTAFVQTVSFTDATPAEIEAVLVAHPAVAEACVVGLPDEEWGQRIVAVVVVREGETVAAEELRELVRAQLRGSKTPESIFFRDELPHTETGKLLRRIVMEELEKESS